MRTENYRNVIIGSGEGGKVLAWHLARPGQQTAIIERRRMADLARTSIVSPARMRSGAPKLRISSTMPANSGVRPLRLRSIWRRLGTANAKWCTAWLKMHLDRYKTTGAELVMDEAKFTGPRTIAVRL